MKKRGVTFIETVVAITIFLIGIIPVAQLTLNSMSNLQRSSEIEEGARVASTVINYIKSQGYDSIMTSGGLLSSYDKSAPEQITQEMKYTLKLTGDGSSYTLDLSDNDEDGFNDDFQADFLGGWDGDVPTGVATPEESLFLINSLGIGSDAIKVTINIATSNLEIVTFNEDSETYSLDSSYANPTFFPNENSIPSGVIVGNSGILEDPIIFGNVYIEYQTLSNTLSEDKFYNQNFVITPMENFTTSP